jgi:Kef-type K+ transport system membrane component KefB
MEFLPDSLSLNAQIAFGLLLFAGVVGGYFVHHIAWIPSVTGFMAVGLLIGPSGIDLLDTEALVMARPLIDVALGLILYRLGLSLNLRAMGRDPRLLVTSLVESVATFGACYFLLTSFGLSHHLAGLAAAIVISSSPAILIHVAHELGARGPVTERAKELVALNNLFAFIAFSAMLPAGHLAVSDNWQTALLQPLYQLFGSLLVAIAIALLLVHIARLTRAARQYRLALIIGALMLGVGVANALHLSALFVPLAMGVVVRTLEGNDPLSEVAFGEAFELFFIVLFVYAGAKIDLSLLGEVGWMALALITVRSIVKLVAVTGMIHVQGRPLRGATAKAMLLVPMAGLAIGLAQTADTLFALEAAQLNALVLAAVAILETVGPPIAAWAFRLSGEAGAAHAMSPEDARNDAKAD